MNDKNSITPSRNLNIDRAGEVQDDRMSFERGSLNENEPESFTPLSRLEMADCKTGAAVLRNGQICRMTPPIRRRILGGTEDDYCYHVMTRTVGAEKIFDAEDLEALRLIIRKMSRFSGVKLMTYCLLKNHFHLLVRVPSKEGYLRRFEDKKNKAGELLEAEGMGEDRLMAHLSILYSKAYMNQLRRELVDMRERGLESAAEVFLEKYKRRFCDLSLFVKEVKERFSRWYNRKHQRIGTLWAGRFKSVLVEDGIALRTMASYIDLNPVRAGIVEDPKDYRWCGYAEAVAGSRDARRGLCRVMELPQDTWDDRKHPHTGEIAQGSGAWYRCWLMQDGMQVREDEGTRSHHVKIRKGVPEEKAAESLENQGMSPPIELILSQAKYLSEGLAIGSQSFVEGLFEKNRKLFGVQRKTTAKPILHKKSGLGLYSLFGKSGKEKKKDKESEKESVAPTFSASE